MFPEERQGTGTVQGKNPINMSSQKRRTSQGETTETYRPTKRCKCRITFRVEKTFTKRIMGVDVCGFCRVGEDRRSVRDKVM